MSDVGPPTTISDEAKPLRDDVIHAWRLSIDAAQIRLGEFDWPWALGLALDEIERLRSAVPYIEAGLRANGAATIDAAHLQRQREFSLRTFGPGSRAKGVVAHIRKELDEVEADPTDLSEWIDVAILALDGAWRSGAAPQQIIDTLIAKQARNEAREWPDWRTAGDDAPIEHVRSVAGGTQEATNG